MCLRSVHSLRLHYVQPFHSFRFATFTSLSFTPFRLRSFHSPQHRTAKAIPSLHYANLHTGFPCHGIPIACTHNPYTFGIAHATTSHPINLLHCVQSLHLPLPAAQRQLYALFFSAAYYPNLNTKSVAVENQDRKSVCRERVCYAV